MARPTKPEAVNLKKTVQYRVPMSRYEELQQEAIQAGFQTVSDYCRFRDLKMKPRRQKANPELLSLVAALGGLGNIRSDINQILKDRQAHKFVKAEQVEKVFCDIEAIAEAIQTVLSDGN